MRTFLVLNTRDVTDDPEALTYEAEEDLMIVHLERRLIKLFLSIGIHVDKLWFKAPVKGGGVWQDQLHDASSGPQIYQASREASGGKQKEQANGHPPSCRRNHPGGDSLRHHLREMRTGLRRGARHLQRVPEQA